MGLDIVTLSVWSTRFDTNAVSCYLELPNILLNQRGWEVDQEIDGKMKWRKMED